MERREPSKAAPIFAALGDPIRLAMVARLCKDSPLRTIELTRGTGVTRQGLIKHLHVLEEAGLVSSDRFGRERQWRMQAEELATVRDYLDQISAQWDLRLERLKAFIEDSA